MTERHVRCPTCKGQKVARFLVSNMPIYEMACPYCSGRGWMTFDEWLRMLDNRVWEHINVKAN